jgi:hypothetical protein
VTGPARPRRAGRVVWPGLDRLAVFGGDDEHGEDGDDGGGEGDEVHRFSAWLR